MSDTNEERDATVTLELAEGYRFRVDFDLPGVPALLMDEPAPIGEGVGPNAARVLAAAVGNCLSASALYCLENARVAVHAMRTTVTASFVRNDAGKLRIDGLRVRIEPVVDDAESGRVRRCLAVFEDYCVVTQSVRGGIKRRARGTPKGRRCGQPDRQKGRLTWRSSIPEDTEAATERLSSQDSVPSECAGGDQDDPAGSNTAAFP